jgi:hypothetical protein
VTNPIQHSPAACVQGDIQNELETKWSEWCKSGNISFPDCEQLLKLAVADPYVANDLYVELYRETDLHGNAKISETVWRLFSLAAAVFLPRVRTCSTPAPSLAPGDVP